MNLKIKQKVDFSIVIPVYQNEGSLEKTFNSLKSNVIDKNPEYCSEVIFVDDNSSDGTKNVIKLHLS